ncbi:MAG: SH3 domain-containing protein [Rhabdochlamydiaceae bacterium]|nr:SH3 domain-containing protein [Candidatus Amphrikana amoebophyrae]
MINSKALCLLLLSATAVASAQDSQNTLISKKEALKLSSLSNSQTGRNKSINVKSGNYKNFTGKVIGNHVRLRSQADVDSTIVREVNKDELLIVTGENNDFYEITPPTDVKAYVFRSFILDNIVEGNRVNVRLAPDLDAPVIGNLNTGDRINGKISERNSKWLEIDPPSNAKFYVAKEFIEYAGGADLKQIHDKRSKDLTKLCNDAYYSGDAEMHKPFEEMNFERISSKFKLIINDYQDFPQETQKAAKKLVALQETYLQKKLQYLEQRSQMLDSKLANSNLESTPSETPISTPVEPVIVKKTESTKMKMWEPLEQALFSTWRSMHEAKNISEFYEAQMVNTSTVTGTLELFSDPIKNKPGSHVVKYRDIPVAFVYSTKLDLDQYVGKKVNLVVAERPNNNFAFPAYYVFDITH